MSSGFTLTELIIVLVIIFFLAGLTTPKFLAARGRANTRACFANQKVLAGVVVRYNREHTRAKDMGSVAPTFLTSGYMLALPDDPGQGPSTFDHYVLYYATAEPTPRVKCTIHGKAE